MILLEWLAFYNAFLLLNIHRSGVLTALAWLVPHETAAVSAQVLFTPYNHAPCHFMQSHIHKVYACSAVTRHLHFWQNDQGLLHVTVTWGWNGYQNKSQHRKSTLEKKILPLLLQGFEPTPFQSWFWHSNHWAIPATGKISSEASPCTTVSLTEVFRSKVLRKWLTLPLMLLSSSRNQSPSRDVRSISRSPAAATQHRWVKEHSIGGYRNTAQAGTGT